MKNFLSKILILGSPILIALIFVNYFGDAARLFDEGYEKSMAEIITAGKYVTNITNYDERVFQKEVITRLNKSPEIVVLGTSRTMLINAEMLKNTNSFNSSVSSASIEDIIALYQLYKDNNKLPQKIIIEIHAWTFNENPNHKRWQSIASYYYKFHEVENEVNRPLFKYKELISFSYFQNSLKKLPDFLSGQNMPVATKKMYNDSSTKLTDGSLVYSKSYRQVTAIEVEEKVNNYLIGNSYDGESYRQMSAKIWEEFNQLINDIKENNIKIEFFLSPYHPTVYKTFKNEYPVVLETEAKIKKLAKTNNIKLYGAFDPDICKMDSTFFYDGLHCKEKGIGQILETNI